LNFTLRFLQSIVYNILSGGKNFVVIVFSFVYQTKPKLIYFMKNTNLHPASIIGILIFLPFLASASGDTLHNNVAVNSMVVSASNIPVKDAEVNILYRVQILALRQPLNVESVKVNGVDGKLYTSKSNDLTRYFMGEFHDLGSANQCREQLVKSGFEDACIVAYKNGDRITIKESLELLGVGK
jgi:hypothetical protein